MSATPAATDATLDPVTFEILRHRLWAINEEAAITIGQISGSPIANEAFDCNTALMNAEGDVVVVGPYIMAHAAAMDQVVKYLLTEYAENPGIGVGDMFVTNDPYVGAMHQADVAVVAPIFADGELIMWCGSVVHQSDVGGPVPGSVAVGAHSIYEEAIPLAPIKIVEAGRMRNDLEREYLIRSRLPGLNALDLRAQIAANNVQIERILAMAERYGTHTLKSAVLAMVTSAESRFKRRLLELPDGRWRHWAFVEHDGLEDRVYEINLTMTKRGDTLELDFTESSDQAPALINCALPTTRGYTLAAILPSLCFDMAWVPAALWRSVTIKTREGSIVRPVWPGGCSMATVSSAHAVRASVATCLSMMFDASENLSAKAMASCMGCAAMQNISGFWDTGPQFGTMLIDSMAGGGGARAAADGADTSGMTNAPAASIGNVETNEYNYPLLYLWRRELADTGGPGRHRGGVGGEHAYIPHHVKDRIVATIFGHGMEASPSPGVAGGEPGMPNGVVVVRGGAQLAARDRSGLSGRAEAMPPKINTTIEPGDVYIHWYTGGGGLGDPIDRPPAEVLADVAEGLVSEEAARSAFGVMVSGDGPGWRVDEAGTEAERAAIRRRRLGGRDPRSGGQPASGRRLAGGLVVSGTGPAAEVACRRCGETLGPPTANFKERMAMTEVPGTEVWPSTRGLAGASQFVLQRFYCPGCAVQLDANVNLAGRAPLQTMEIFEGSAP